MKLISNNDLGGFGGIGEGMGMSKTADGRRIMWLGHEGPPKNFTGVDVTDPANPKVIVQTDLPHNKMRSNSLEVCGDYLIVAHQIRGTTIPCTPAGFDIWDISKPETPRKISHYDTSGAHSWGVHCVWCVDGEYVHISSGAADFEPNNENDHQFYQIVDIRNPSKPVEAGRRGDPGPKKGETPPPFDLLYWNSDATNLPGPLYAWYLRQTYLENNLVKPGKAVICGEKVDLRKVDVPVYIYGSPREQIVPPKSAPSF